MLELLFPPGSPRRDRLDAALTWLLADRKHQLIAALTVVVLLFGGLTGLFGTTAAYLAFRGPDVVEKPIEVKAKLVAVTIGEDEDLGSVGKPYGRSRPEMIGANMDLIRANTKKCDALGRTTGMCKRTTFAEETLAYDAAWPGDVAYVITKDSLAMPALASNN